MLDPFYLVIDRAEWLPRLLPLGLKLVQIRTKAPDAAVRRNEVRRSLELCRAAGAVCVVNDFWELALEFGASWLHLGQEDLAGADLAAIRRAGIRFGVSVTSDDEFERAMAVDPHHLGVGAVYPTPSKADIEVLPDSLAAIARWKRRAGRPVVAIGGITLERAPEVLATGVDSLAVISDVLGSPDPEARCRAWVAASRTWRIGRDAEALS